MEDEGGVRAPSLLKRCQEHIQLRFRWGAQCHRLAESEAAGWLVACRVRAAAYSSAASFFLNMVVAPTAVTTTPTATIEVAPVAAP